MHRAHNILSRILPLLLISFSSFHLSSHYPLLHFPFLYSTHRRRRGILLLFVLLIYFTNNSQTLFTTSLLHFFSLLLQCFVSSHLTCLYSITLSHIVDISPPENANTLSSPVIMAHTASPSTATISSHILDTRIGKPAYNVSVWNPPLLNFNLPQHFK